MLNHARDTNAKVGDLDSGLIDVDPEYQREVVWTGECDLQTISLFSARLMLVYS
jgi:hypothetical protein